jgi:hypothetical protein
MSNFGIDILVGDKPVPYELENKVQVPAGYAYKIRLTNENNQRALARVFHKSVQVDEELLPANNFNDVHIVFAAPGQGLAEEIKVEFHLQKEEVKGRLGLNFNIDIFPHPHPYYPPPYYPPYNPYYPPPAPYPYPYPPPYRQEAKQEVPVPQTPNLVRSVNFDPESTTVKVIIEGV